MVCLATVLLGRWVAYWQLLARRRTDAANVQAVEAALARRISTAPIAGPRCKLRDVLQHLADHCDVPLKIDREQSERIAPASLSRLDVPRGEFSVEELLTLVTERVFLGWRREGNAIVITTAGNAEPMDQPYMQVYPLPAGTLAGDALTDDAEELCELITTTIEPDKWIEVGGPGVIQPAGGALVVFQTPQMHRRIQALLANMASLPGGSPRGFPLAGTGQIQQALLKKLARRDSVDFHQEPLADVLETLSQRHQVPILVHWDKLAPSGVFPDTPVTLSISNEPVMQALNAIIDDRPIIYGISGPNVVISLRQSLEWCCTWFYDVRNLVDERAEFGSDDLIEVITTNVEPDTWDDVGGPGTLAALSGNWLVVSQSPDVQYEVQQLLARMRAILHPGSEVDRLWLSQADDVSLAVEEVLDREVTLKYAEAPLCDVCDDLSRRLKIPVRLRRRALEEAAVTPDQLVSIDLPPLPLRDALALLLEHFPLTFDNDRLAFDPRGEVLHVTTQDDADRNMLTRIIDVRHLISPGAGGMDEDTLIELVTTCVAPDSWDEVGGPGTTDIYRGLLVFSQTYDISRQVQDLIDAISEHCLPPTHYGDNDQLRTTEPVWVTSGSAKSLLQRLSVPTQLEVTEVPWDQALLELAAGHNIPLAIDRIWVEEMWGGQPTWNGATAWNISLSMKNRPLEEILRALADKANGDLWLKHGVPYVSAKDAGIMMLRLYPRSALQRDGKPLGIDEIQRLLTGDVEPDSWDFSNGPGVLYEVNGDWLLIGQTLNMHRRIEETLTKLRAGEALPQPPMLDP